MRVSVLLNNFSSGEVSPLLAARPDTAPFNTGARKLENFVPLITGGVSKRPGTWFDGFTRNDLPARLIDFPLSGGRYVIVELTEYHARFWNDDFTLSSTELPMPYPASHIRDVKYAANRDELWLAHPSHPPQKIAWNGGAFTLSVPAFKGITFSAAGDYPAAIAFDSGRLFLAGTDNHPNGVWGSRPPDGVTGLGRYTDFTVTEDANPSDALYLEESDMYGSRIQWILSGKSLFAATNRASWTDTGEVPTPASFDMEIIEYGGSSGVQGKAVRDTVVYAGRSGKSLRVLIYNPSTEISEDYQDLDISEAGNHLFIRGIRDLCCTEYPSPLAWIVTEDGGLVSCTLNVRAGVIAYARHTLGGDVEAVAAGPGKTEDVLWAAVNRQGRRYVEHIVIKNVIGNPYGESHYVDSGVRLELPAPSKIVGGLSHLAGREVHGLGDGSVLPPRQVSPAGTVEYDIDVQKLHIGLAYASVLVPTVPEIPANGTSMAKKRRIEKATLRLYESFGGTVGWSEEKMEVLSYMRYGKYVLGEAPEPFTGDVDVTVSGIIEPNGTVIVRHDEPAPFTVLALIEHIALMEV